MNLYSVARLTYVSAWIFAAISLLYRAVLFTGRIYRPLFPASSRGVLFFAAFLFLASIATSQYAQLQDSSRTKTKSNSA
ncbi:MAG: hypothetical protein ACRD3E_02550 [Terriglobales bacterium]